MLRFSYLLSCAAVVGQYRCFAYGSMVVMRRVDEVLRLLVDGTGGVLGTDRGCRTERDDEE